MAEARSLYRSLLRVALAMPDPHRTNLVVFRARSEFDLARTFPPDSPQAADALVEGELYLDNLQHQATHLTRLSFSHTLIPVNLRATNSATATTPPRRRLLAAIQARAVAKLPRKAAPGGGNRFMQGPEPSWIAKRRLAEQGGEQGLRPAAKASGEHSHAHGHVHKHDGSCCS